MIHAVAIDDEPVALSIIRQFCLRDGDVALDSYSDPVEGLEAVRRVRPQLVFLDIEMNGISGLDVARTLPEGTFLIFTTAYARFALDGFELSDNEREAIRRLDTGHPLAADFNDPALAKYLLGYDEQFNPAKD